MIGKLSRWEPLSICSLVVELKPSVRLREVRMEVNARTQYSRIAGNVIFSTIMRAVIVVGGM